MTYTNRIAQQLHEEHVAVIALMDKLQNFVSGAQADTSDSQVNNFLGDLAVAIEGEVTNHFQFEEEDLFPILVNEGEMDMPELLSDDHEIILPLGNKLAAMAREAQKNGFNEESWREFKQYGSEFSDRLRDHASKEEIGLVPLLDDLILAGVDEDLSAKYIENRA